MSQVSATVIVEALNVLEALQGMAPASAQMIRLQARAGLLTDRLKTSLENFSVEVRPEP